MSEIETISQVFHFNKDSSNILVNIYLEKKLPVDCSLVLSRMGLNCHMGL